MCVIVLLIRYEYILNVIILKSIGETKWDEDEESESAWVNVKWDRCRRQYWRHVLSLLSSVVSCHWNWLPSGRQDNLAAMATNRKATASSKRGHDNDVDEDDRRNRTHYTKISNNNFIHHLLHALWALHYVPWMYCVARCCCVYTRNSESSGRGRDEAFRKQISSVMNAKRQLRLDLDTFNWCTMFT